MNPVEYAPPHIRKAGLLNIITGLFVAVLVICTVISGKIIAIGPLNMPGGVLLFPIVFIFNDILTEVYGYERSRQVIWTGFFCQALAAVSFFAVGVLPAAPFWPHQEAYDLILGFAPRVAIAGLIAFFTGEMANSAVLSRMKYRQGGARGLRQGWRFTASTIVGEGINSVVFMTVAYGGKLTLGDLARTTLTLYVVKVVYETLALPLSIIASNWVKRVEGIDKIDVPEQTNYNPFVIT